MKRLFSQTDLLKKILVSLALLSVTALAYWGVAGSAFINLDDHVYVLKNPALQNGLSLEGLRWAFTTAHGGNWHPVTWLSHMLDVQLFGLNPGPHHLVNLLLHLANTLLLFLFLNKVTGALWRSAFVAALFALHPLHVESVAWISERKDVLSTFFGLLAFWSYACFVEAKIKLGNLQGEGPTRPALYYSLSLAFFALGLMSKPMLVTLPCLLLLLDFWPLGRFRLIPAREPIAPGGSLLPSFLSVEFFRRVVREKIPFFVLAGASSVATIIAQDKSGAIVSLQRLSLASRAANAAVAYVAYLWKMIWPHDLAVMYPLRTWPAGQVIAATALLLVISISIVKFADRRPYLFTGWFWYLGMLVPVIGLVHVGSQAMADRYTYLPMLGILVVVAWTSFDLLQIPRLRIMAGLVVLPIIGCCFVLTREQVAYWKDSETLFKHAILATKHNALMQSNLAAMYIDAGRSEEAFALLSEAAAMESNDAQAQNNFGYLLLMRGQVEKASAHLLLALDSNPQFPEANFNLGNALYLRGQPEQALACYEKAVRYRPDYPEAHGNWARTLLALGQLDKALFHAQTALKLNPDFLKARDTLGKIFLQRGQLSEAEDCFRQLSQREPENANYIDSLGVVLMARKDFSRAAEAFSRAILLDSHQPAFPFHLGNSLLALNQIVPARQAYRKAIAAQPDYAEAHYQLAMILMSEGKMDDAAQELASALKSKPEWLEALNNLAWILATDKDSSVRNGSEATRLAEKALKVGGATASNLDTLAAAYAEAGKFEPAVEFARKAVGLATSSSQTKMAEEISTRLQAYENKTPWREP